MIAYRLLQPQQPPELQDMAKPSPGAGGFFNCSRSPPLPRLCRRCPQKYPGSPPPGLPGAERTWQALAWEPSARVAMAERDLQTAQDCDSEHTL